MMEQRRRKEYYPRVNPFDRYTAEKFKTRYRLPKEIVEGIAEDFSRSPFAKSAGTSRSSGISHGERVCLALRYLATGAFYTAIGDTQGVHKSTVCRAVTEVTDYLYSVCRHHVRFPRPEDYSQSASKFYAMAGMPLTVGCVDGTHVAIRAPHHEEGAYVNRKGYHSLNVQIVCDADMRIIHVDASNSGCQNDAYVWGQSLLHEAGENGMLGGFYMLGDSGYPLKDYILTPFVEPATRAQEAYNQAHTTTRSIIERTIGVWKSTWRCLDDSGGRILSTPFRASRMIVSCCVLHNMYIDAGMPEALENDDDADAARPLNVANHRRRQRRRARLAAQMIDGLNNVDNDRDQIPYRNRRAHIVATRFQH